MKTHLIKITTQPVKKLPVIPATSIRAFLVSLSLFVATSIPVLAVDAVWLLNPDTNNWNSGFNWSTSPSAPVNPGDTATFNTSTVTSLTLSGNVTVESITFRPGASAFTITTNGNVLTIEGAGIVNNSGATQRINDNGAIGGEISVTPGLTEFFNTSTAGNAAITNNGSAFSGGFGGSTGFFNTSTAGNATITNNGSAFSGGFGLTEFFNTSTAGNAAITNNGSAFSGGFGGSTGFFNTSTAGNATITNNGSAFSGGFGGSTGFFNTSTAGNATIITNGGTGGSPAGRTLFSDSSDGGTARAITNGNGSFDIS